MADVGGASKSRSGNSASSKVTVSFTGISVASNGTTAKITSPKVQFYSKTGWADSTNRTRCRGGAVTDETLATNTSFDGSPTTHTWSCTATSVTLSFTSEVTSTFIGEVAGVSFYENDNNSDYYGPSLTVRYPMRVYTAPIAPTVSLTRASDAQATIAISGNQNTNTEDKYWQYIDWQLQTDNGAFAGGTTGLAGTTTSINATGLVANRRYRVQACARNRDATGNYAQSNYIYTTPAAPVFDGAGWNAGYTGIVLDWTLNTAPGVTSVTIQRSPNGSSWSTLVSGITTDSYTDSSIADPYSSDWYYRINCQTPAPVLNSGYSATIMVPKRTMGTPSTPTVSLARNSDTQLTMSISGNQNNPADDGYWKYIDWQIQTDGGSFTGGATGIAGSTTSVSITTGISANHRYRVQARSRNDSPTNNTSAYGVSGYVYTTPATPILSAVQWDSEYAGVEVHYLNPAPYSSIVQIYKSVDGGSGWALLTSASSSPYTDTTATEPYSSYIRYRIRAQTPVPIVYSAYTSLQAAPNLSSIYKGSQSPMDVYKGTVHGFQVYLGDKRIW